MSFRGSQDWAGSRASELMFAGFQNFQKLPGSSFMADLFTVASSVSEAGKEVLIQRIKGSP